jgi:hypothetical protein
MNRKKETLVRTASGPPIVNMHQCPQRRRRKSREFEAGIESSLNGNVSTKKVRKSNFTGQKSYMKQTIISNVS